MPNKWEIWLAKVKFEDEPNKVKERPVLVISPEQCFILSFKITSHKPRYNDRLDYPIKKWAEVGLQKQSTIRISKLLQLIKKDFTHKIGRLHPIDILAVIKILQNSKK